MDFGSPPLRSAATDVYLDDPEGQIGRMNKLVQYEIGGWRWPSTGASDTITESTDQPLQNPVQNPVQQLSPFGDIYAKTVRATDERACRGGQWMPARPHRLPTKAKAEAQSKEILKLPQSVNLAKIPEQSHGLPIRHLTKYHDRRDSVMAAVPAVAQQAHSAEIVTEKRVRADEVIDLTGLESDAERQSPLKRPRLETTNERHRKGRSHGTMPSFFQASKPTSSQGRKVDSSDWDWENS